jgi:hypothetical protein
MSPVSAHRDETSVLQEPHAVTSQKTAFFIGNEVRLITIVTTAQFVEVLKRFLRFTTGSESDVTRCVYKSLEIICSLRSTEEALRRSRLFTH